MPMLRRYVRGCAAGSGFNGREEEWWADGNGWWVFNYVLKCMLANIFRLPCKCVKHLRRFQINGLMIIGRLTESVDISLRT